MKKSYNLKEIYQNLESNRKKLARRSIVLALFFLGINIYAWFIYISKVNVDVNADVIAWDIGFFDGANQVKKIEINEQIYPGMPTYRKKIVIANKGEAKGRFLFSIDNITILGQDSLVEDGTLEDQILSLENDYPFSIKLNYDKTELKENESMEFELTIDWDYEDNINVYKRLTKQYTFDPSVTYYGYTDEEYVPFEVTSSSFENNKFDLFLEKDDADSFFGEACANYERQSKKTCVTLNLTLEVDQDI